MTNELEKLIREEIQHQGELREKHMNISGHHSYHTGQRDALFWVLYHIDKLSEEGNDSGDKENGTERSDHR